MLPSMRRTRSTEGYTLFELVVVVAIMGAMAALVAPGLAESMADSRQNGAAEEMLRINRVLRARVNETGLAHLLLFQATNNAAGSFGLGNAQVWEGMNNRCNTTPWAAALAGGAENGFSPVESLDLGNSAYNMPRDSSPPRADDVGRQVIRMFASGTPTSALLCFEPGGATYTAVANTAMQQIGYVFTPQTAAVTFTVTRSMTTSGGEAVTRGVDRVVIFPAGGNGRLWF